MNELQIEDAIVDSAVDRVAATVDAYVAAAVAELRAEIARLRASRDEWMERSNAHAMEADRHRVTIVNLRGRIYELENHR